MCAGETREDISVRDRISFHVILFILCLFIVIFGITGNVTVVYIYSRRLKIPIFGLFVKILAVCDIITVCVAIPCLTVFRLTPDNIDTGMMCKALTFIEHFSAANSGIIFITIAVQRFMKICRPTKKQISEKVAKRLILMSIIMSFGGSIPIVFFLGGHNVNIVWGSRNVTVAICDFIPQTKGDVSSTVYTVLVSLELVGITTTLVVLYAIIARALRTHALKRSESFRPNTGGRPNKHTSTMIFFVLTVVFLISLAPMVAVSMFFSQVDVTKNWTHADITGFDLGVNLLFVNCIANPIVYSFVSAGFRRECLACLSSLNPRRRSTDNEERHKDHQNTSVGEATMSTLSTSS